MWHIDLDISSSLYLVVMIVFITHTVNDAIVMVDLSGAFFPSVSTAFAVGIANSEYNG